MSEVNLIRDRLDAFLVKEGYFKSRDRANEAVKRGDVSVNGNVIKKPSQKICPEDKILLLKDDFQYVSRAALKLKAAVEEFEIKVEGRVCLDIGVATGGFSDYLLSIGARKVFGVDIGEGQIAKELLHNKKFEFRNFSDARELKPKDFEVSIDLMVVDVSFISVSKFIDMFSRFKLIDTEFLILIKPQFEMGREKKSVKQVLEDLRYMFNSNNFNILREMPSPVLGKEGTQEYLWHIS